MHTIEISDKTYDFLQYLAKELASQDNRSTQDVWFVVAYQTRSWNTKFDTRAWVFLTAIACDNHIAQNDYHYPKWAFSYWIHFWRNYEMVKLIWAVLEIAWVEKPSNYSSF